MYQLLINLNDDCTADEAADLAENVMHELNVDVTLLKAGVEITTFFAD